MADTGWLSGATAVEDQTDGSVSWSADYSELLLADGTTIGSGGDSGDPTCKAQLVIGGVRSGSQKPVSLPSDVAAYVTVGGPTDKWGLTPSQAQVVASTFGSAVQITQGAGYYWGVVKNVSSGVPEGSAIDGLEVRVKGYVTEIEPGFNDIQIDHVQVKIYYTEGGGAPSLSVIGVADNGTYAYGNVPVNTPTSHQFTITNTGDGADELGTLTISGDGWSIDAADDPSGDPLAASGTTTVTVVGTFATAGEKTGILTIPSDDAASPYVINLTATAVSSARAQNFLQMSVD